MRDFNNTDCVAVPPLPSYEGVFPSHQIRDGISRAEEVAPGADGRTINGKENLSQLRKTTNICECLAQTSVLTAWNGLSKIRPAGEMAVVSRPAPRDPPPLIAPTSLT